ncbi:NUDIX domain-containing protein [Novosphingobium resinovorum]|uniref:NUDIX domain-containing protein n=1 Tax=Novosphingobium resinovorum TaxID=158500 RepID=UPI002ED0FADD
MALDREGGVLLVRHSYGSDKWMPPGGGLKPGEEPILAARRELSEETGCILADARLIATVTETLHGTPNTVRVVRGDARGDPRPDGREIVEARFFPLDALPSPMPTGLAERLHAWAGDIRAASE